MAVFCSTASDTAGHQGLWVTNGTGAGTQELTGSTAAATGIDPTDMTVFSGEVLFNGVDAGLSGLWAWNGTGATELLAGGGTSSTKGLNPTDLTVFGNEVLFNGLDQNGDPQLWVTNGTTAARTNLPASPARMPLANASGIAPSDLTVFNGEVFFSGRDTTGHFQLWETNGTVAGTQEVTTAANGVSTRSQHRPIWKSMTAKCCSQAWTGMAIHDFVDDGRHGQREHRGDPTNIANTWSTGLHPTDLTAVSISTPPPPATTPPNFFNSDDKADILWQNANGDTA